MTERLGHTRLLHHTKLEDYQAMDFIRQNLLKVIRLHTMTSKIVCPPAHVMGCLIAAIAYRKLQPDNEEFFQKNEYLVKVFGELNVTQWLSVAIQVFAEVGSHVFLIELDEACQKPVAKLEQLGGISCWVVTTRMPQVNRFEDILRQVFGPTHKTPRPVYPKLEPYDRPLLSVEPDDIPNSPIALNEDDELEDNNISLRDYTRQMKTLAKRLTTPDRAIAKRARREILKKPHEVGEQQVDEASPPKEFFDSYTHLKDVWKTCLKNQVSIPNSLRVLVDHHCTPSQVFHLMELEKEHIAEM
ncbi:uncharacterized protein FMAN_02154 [Fusarium mangiferae]|uniref:Uncharacterized protein n=1 Tax=Fusarium mangiferae TaxID=192010 RepID=A0A1L7TN05_FUSMA|nr:uncharacterized protein FMAN_02154 [Fusarium mangiferae]CVK99299.1 uncharacterized protein FMAN_02154 [Fusarium mangiferae]